VLAGVQPPTGGAATIDGADVRGRPGAAAYMAQKDLLLPWRRALDNAILGRELDGADRTEARARAAAWFERFGLSGFEDAWPHELSGGMRQRLALLRTFLFHRDVLLLDEPFGALDAITRQDMVAWLAEVWAADRRTALLVTHDVEEALLLSDRVEVMSARPGTIVASIPVGLERPRPAELVTDPAFVALRARVMQALRAGRAAQPDPGPLAH
jgi:ABC-type nitrate/sulfonate/bicarbonate transport system ATPase subunit